MADVILTIVCNKLDMNLGKEVSCPSVFFTYLQVRIGCSKLQELICDLSKERKKKSNTTLKYSNSLNADLKVLL